MILAVVEWDTGNWPKCGKHGVEKAEIDRFFATEPSVRPDPHPEERRFRAIGPGSSGRYLFVVFTFREKEGVTYIRPLSARYMHRKEVQRYEQDSPEAASYLHH